MKLIILILNFLLLTKLNLIFCENNLELNKNIQSEVSDNDKIIEETNNNKNISCKTNKSDLDNKILENSKLISDDNTTSDTDLKREKKSTEQLTTICVEIKPSNPNVEPYFMCRGSKSSPISAAIYDKPSLNSYQDSANNVGPLPNYNPQSISPNFPTKTYGSQINSLPNTFYPSQPYGSYNPQQQVLNNLQPVNYGLNPVTYSNQLNYPNYLPPQYLPQPFSYKNQEPGFPVNNKFYPNWEPQSRFIAEKQPFEAANYVSPDNYNNNNQRTFMNTNTNILNNLNNYHHSNSGEDLYHSHNSGQNHGYNSYSSHGYNSHSNYGHSNYDYRNANNDFRQSDKSFKEKSLLNKEDAWNQQPFEKSFYSSSPSSSSNLYPSPLSNMNCGTSLLISCQPHVMPIPCSTRNVNNNYIHPQISPNYSKSRPIQSTIYQLPTPIQPVIYYELGQARNDEEKDSNQNSNKHDENTLKSNKSNKQNSHSYKSQNNSETEKKFTNNDSTIIQNSNDKTEKHFNEADNNQNNDTPTKHQLSSTDMILPQSKSFHQQTNVEPKQQVENVQEEKKNDSSLMKYAAEMAQLRRYTNI